MPADPDAGEIEDPRGHEGAPPVPLDAPVESAPADELLGGGGSAADRGPVPAAGVPAELTSDDDRPGQSPDGAAETSEPKPRAPRDGLAPGEVPAVATGEVPAVATTSSRAVDDVPVVAPAGGGQRVATEGGDTEREGVPAPATTAGDDPGASVPAQPAPATPPTPAKVADEPPLAAVTDDGTPVPADSSAMAVTTTEVGDEIAAQGDVERPSATMTDPAGPVTAGPLPAADDVPSVDVHAEPSVTDAPGDVVASSSDAATNPPVDAPTDLPATGGVGGAGQPTAAGSPVADVVVDAPVPSDADADAPVADEPAVDAPATDGPAAGQPAVPVPVPSDVDAPVAEVPATDAAAGAPVVEAPAADAPATEAPAVVPEPEPVVVDEERQPLLDLLAEHLGEGLVATHVVPGRDMTVRVTREAWVKTAEVCRDVLGMRSFSFLSAMDWMPSPYGRSEDGGLAGAGDDAAVVAADPASFEPGTTGGETRFQVLARLEAPVAPSLGITVKCDVPADDLVVATWSKVFPGADWHERECAEMFGIDFAGHPNLVKLYLPGAFEGFPLRKDFPLLARDVKPWPGLVDVEAMPGEEASDDDDESVSAGVEEG